MIAPTELRLVLVTPETTLVDTPVRSLRFPLFDGQFGVLPGRAPVIGRLGQGELRFETNAGAEQYYIEDGFLQIRGGVVTLLTSRAISAEDIDPDKVQKEFDAALAMSPKSDQEYADKKRAMARGRNLLSMKSRF